MRWKRGKIEAIRFFLTPILQLFALFFCDNFQERYSIERLSLYYLDLDKGMTSNGYHLGLGKGAFELGGVVVGYSRFQNETRFHPTSYPVLSGS